jgi:DnaJ-class molecular chaperone
LRNKYIFIFIGTEAGKKIKFDGEGNEEPGITSGDLIIVIEEKRHPLFTRKGKDLVINKTLSLSEALLGFSFKIATLDNRLLSIKSTQGDVIKPGVERFIPREGMPVYRSPLEKGVYMCVFLFVCVVFWAFLVCFFFAGI